MSEFKDKLRALINTESIENGSDTPDWILADYMEGCLFAFEDAIAKREHFFGRAGEDV